MADEDFEGGSDLVTIEGEFSRVDGAALATLTRAEISQAVATAKQYPRDVEKAISFARRMVTQDEDTAEESVYAVKRGGKMVEGPSVRFAEVFASGWGNMRTGARIVDESEQFITAQAVAHDLERNVGYSIEVPRRIVDSKGRRYGIDMIGVTAMAAVSIAIRNSILKTIPSPIWKPVYLSARAVLAGDVRTLESRRARVIKAFGTMGVTPEQIFALLDVRGEIGIGVEELVRLRAVYNGLRTGETSLEGTFPRGEATAAPASPGAAKEEAIKERLRRGRDANSQASGPAKGSAATGDNQGGGMAAGDPGRDTPSAGSAAASSDEPDRRVGDGEAGRDHPVDGAKAAAAAGNVEAPVLDEKQSNLIEELATALAGADTPEEIVVIEEEFEGAMSVQPAHVVTAMRGKIEARRVGLAAGEKAVDPPPSNGSAKRLL